MTWPGSILDLDLFLRYLLEGVALDVLPLGLNWSSGVASLEFATFRLLFLQGDLSFSLFGKGDWASVKWSILYC